MESSIRWQWLLETRCESKGSAGIRQGSRAFPKAGGAKPEPCSVPRGASLVSHLFSRSTVTRPSNGSRRPEACPKGRGSRSGWGKVHGSDRGGLLPFWGLQSYGGHLGESSRAKADLVSVFPGYGP